MFKRVSNHKTVTGTKFYMYNRPNRHRVYTPAPVIPPPSGGGSYGLEDGITYTDYVLPSSIDYSGATNVSSSIYSWISANVPNGTDETHHNLILPYTANAQYLIDGNFTAEHSFVMKGTSGNKRRHISIYGGGYWNNYPITHLDATDSTDRANVRAAYAAFDRGTDWHQGAKLIRRTGGSSAWNSLFFGENAYDIQISGWDIDGENPNIGVAGNTGQLTSVANEHSCLFHTRAGVQSMRMHDSRVQRWRWFGWLENNLGGSGGSPFGNSMYRTFLEGAEMGIAPVDTLGLEAYHNIITDTSLIPIDLEGEAESGQVEDVNIHHNIIDRWGIGHWYQTCWCFAGNPNNAALSLPYDRFTFADNYVPEGQVRGTLTNGAINKGGLSFRSDKVNPKSDWVITRNYTDWEDLQVAHSGRAYNQLATINNFEYTDNQIPMHGTEQDLFLYNSDSGGTAPPTGTVTITGNDIS